MEQSFGEYLRELRGKMSLREASRKTGLSHTYIRDLELGKKNDPSHDTLAKLANAYGVKYGDLLSKKFSSIDYPNLIDQFGPPNKGYCLENEILSLLGRNEVTYKGNPLTDEECQQIKDMLKVIFPNKKWKESNNES